jgi:hypothetical protein
VSSPALGERPFIHAINRGLEMAFNPLHAFRKRQKTGLAILAILCMFLFILQFGRGDIFERLGIGRSRKDEIVLKQPDDEKFLMNGKKVTGTDLYQLSHQRLMANTYLGAAYGTAADKIESDINRLQDDMKKGAGFEMDSFKKYQELNQKKQKLDRLSAPYRVYTQMHGPQRDLLLKIYGDYIQADTLLNELLDFSLWREEAKRLGLYLTNEDIDKLIKDSTEDLADLAKAQEVIKGNRKLSNPDQPVTASQIYDAVREELIVNQAKNAFLGSFDVMTPSERYEAFRKDRTANFVALMGLPVKDFLAKVESLQLDEDELKKHEDELKKLFERYKDKEYSPERSKPAFMEPRRVSLEWVSGQADSKHYRDLARNLVLSTVAATPLDPLGGVALANLILKEYKARESSFKMPPVTEPDFVLPFLNVRGRRLERNLNQPDIAASFIGLTAMDYPVSAMVSYPYCPLPALVGLQSSVVARAEEKEKDAVQREVDKRIKIGASLVLSSADPFTLTAGLLWADLTQQRQYLPLEVVGDQLLQDVEAKVARALLVDNLAKFKKELEAKRFKPKEAREWLDKAIDEYGLTKHVTVSKPLGRYEFADDPEMAPFKEAYLRQRSSDDPKADQFGAMFLDERAGKTSVFSPKEWPDGVLNRDNESRFADVNPILYWKTEEDRMPREMTFDEARSKVEAAWQFQKARALAKKEAEEMLAKARDSGGDTQTLKDLAAEHHANYSELSGVARFVNQDAGGGMAGKMYQPYAFPKDTIPHSDAQTTAKIRDQLLELKKKGDSVVFANQPEDYFYVGTLYLRHDQNLNDFYPVYRDSTRTGTEKDHLFEEMDGENLRKLLQERIKQLRGKAAPVNEDGSYKVDSEQKAELEKRLKPTN